MKNIVVGTFLLVMPAISYASCSGGACLDVKIQELQVGADGVVYIQTSGTETALNCTPEANTFIKLNATTDGGKIIFSSLLASHTADKNVNVRVVDNVSPCQVLYVTVK